MTTATIPKPTPGHTKGEATGALERLRPFIGPSQRAALASLCRGEERQFFFDKLCELDAYVQRMAATYETDGEGENAIVWLHYFAGGQASWWIMEKDADTDGQGQCQAFGLADLIGDGGEVGYISIVELLENNAELDLYFTPCTLAEVRKELAA